MGPIDMELVKLVSGYSLIVGVIMIAMWAVFASTGQIPEIDERPKEIAFHLAAELLTATALIAGGTGLMLRREWGHPMNTAGLGMLAYTVVVSPGYYAESGEFAFVGMFAVLMILTLAFITLSVIKRSEFAVT